MFWWNPIGLARAQAPRCWWAWLGGHPERWRGQLEFTQSFISHLGVSRRVNSIFLIWPVDCKILVQLRQPHREPEGKHRTNRALLDRVCNSVSCCQTGSVCILITFVHAWSLVLFNQMTTLPAKVKVRACWRAWGGAYIPNFWRYEGWMDCYFINSDRSAESVRFRYTKSFKMSHFNISTSV